MTGFYGHDKQYMAIVYYCYRYNTWAWYIIIIGTHAHAILYTHYTYVVP